MVVWGKGYFPYLQDPDCNVDRAANDKSKNFVTQAKKMTIDAYVALDKLYKDPDPISDSDTFKHSNPCSTGCNEDDDDEENSTAQSNDDAPKQEMTLVQSRTHSSVVELSKNPMEHNEWKIVAQANSYYNEKFEQEHKRRMAAEKLVKELQVENKAILEKFRVQKDEIAQLHQENGRLKQEHSNSQKATDQLKSTIEDLTQYEKMYQKEMQNLHENVSQMKEELDQVKKEFDQSMAENTQLEEHVQALEADKEQLYSQVQSLSPASRWKIDYDDLEITANVLGTGAWGFVKEGEFHGTKVAVKGIHQAIISVADEVIQREFDMMAQVRHPNLVLLIGIVFDDPRHMGPLIITELLDCDMRSAYEGNKLDRQCRLQLLRDVAAALNYLHSRKQPIIHRDISSANVMLEALANGKWKRAKLCDFGSAKLTSRASTPAPGTAIYSAPEILPATKGKQTVKVDVYSFGVLYCEILLARSVPPNLDPTADDFFKFISDLKRLKGKDIHHTAHSCTNKNPKKRPTMKDVLQDIDQHTIANTVT
jgi:ubiquitin thioesterase CYLD/serine/threonine-protein kinase TNNI3K